MEDIEKILLFLTERFYQFDWDVEVQIGKYQIMVNDLDFYRSKEFDKWRKILHKKYPNVGFFFCYKNFKHK